MNADREPGSIDVTPGWLAARLDAVLDNVVCVSPSALGWLAGALAAQHHRMEPRLRAAVLRDDCQARVAATAIGLAQAPLAGELSEAAARWEADGGSLAAALRALGYVGCAQSRTYLRTAARRYADAGQEELLADAVPALARLADPVGHGVLAPLATSTPIGRLRTWAAAQVGVALLGEQPEALAAAVSGAYGPEAQGETVRALALGGPGSARLLPTIDDALRLVPPALAGAVLRVLAVAAGRRDSHEPPPPWAVPVAQDQALELIRAQPPRSREEGLRLALAAAVLGDAGGIGALLDEARNNRFGLGVAAERLLATSPACGEAAVQRYFRRAARDLPAEPAPGHHRSLSAALAQGSDLSGWPVAAARETRALLGSAGCTGLTPLLHGGELVQTLLALPNVRAAPWESAILLLEQTARRDVRLACHRLRPGPGVPTAPGSRD
jgi:hypothetical protein